jgi:hypothetical protein
MFKMHQENKCYENYSTVLEQHGMQPNKVHLRCNPESNMQDAALHHTILDPQSMLHVGTQAPVTMQQHVTLLFTAQLGERRGTVMK